MASNPSAGASLEKPLQDADRSMWLSYLGRLNDRDLQHTRASGVTTWALLAVAAAAVYKCLLHVPDFLAKPAALEQSVVVFLLEADALVLLGGVFLFLLAYCEPPSERRLVPALHKRARSLLQAAAFVFAIIITAVHVDAGSKFRGPRVIGLTVLALGIWWGFNIAVGIIRAVRTASRARKHKVPIIQLEGFFAPGDWRHLVGACFALLLGVVASWAFVKDFGVAGKGLLWMARPSQRRIVPFALGGDRFRAFRPRSAFRREGRLRRAREGHSSAGT